MSSGLDKAIKDIIQVFQEVGKNKPAPFDTQAEVLRVDGDTAWVHIPGGVDETPVKLTINAKVGDKIQIHVGGGRAWITGNATAPPTDDRKANIATEKAEIAGKNATSAAELAESAMTDAEKARAAAILAETSAEDAQGSAKIAKDGADSAIASASTALNQLDIIENVVGVLSLLSKHGEYRLTTDEEVTPDKWYFILTESGEYQVVSNPTGNPSALGYYELVNINQAIQNYVSSHLVLDGNGLWLQTDGSTSKLQLSPSNGVVIYNELGNQVAQYGADTIIGDPEGFHIKLDSDDSEIGFYQGATNKVAYMNGSELYVENSLSFGKFMFYQRTNRHFTLKYLGGDE